MPKFRTMYDPCPDEGTKCLEETRTQQHQKDDTDINLIMKRATRSGVLASSFMSRGNPRFGDFTKIASFQDAYNQITQAQAAFAALPSALRTRFENDPGKLIAFLEDPTNKEEAINLGLVERPPVPEAAPTIADGKGTPAQ